MKIFVYGTLRPGYWNNELLRDSEYLGQVVTDPLYDLFHDGIPYLTVGEYSVRGDIYSVTEKVRNRLDELEGHPDFYKRIRVHIHDTPFNNEVVEGYVISRDVVLESSWDPPITVEPDQNGIKEWLIRDGD